MAFWEPFLSKAGFTMWRDSKASSSPTRRQRQSPPLNSKLSSECSTHTPGVLDDRMLSGCKHIGKHHCEDDLESCVGGSGDERMSRHKPYHHHHHHHYHHHHHHYQQHSSSGHLQQPPQHSSGNPKEGTSSKYNSFDLNQPRVHDVYNVYRCETYSQAELPEESLHQRSNCSGNDASSTSSKAELLLSALIARGSKVNPLKRKWVTSAAATSAEGASKKLVSSAATKATELAERFTRLDISHHEDNNVAQPPLPPPLPPPPRPNAPLAIPQLRTQCWGTDSSSEETEGNFEENILSGRLRPVCKVDGFTADLGASGNFCPQHLKLPVTVSFFSVEPHSAPYLGEINLGKKGYTVPRSGTIQLTLLNPLGTVIKMFVVGYDVSDMPSNSHTFIRQRTVSTEPPNANKLRYLIHLRLRSSKSGRVSLTSDIQVILSRQYDVDSSIGLDFESGCLKSITITPSSPRYSANK
uniref:DUF4210 domain-containing protein n=1 Tax=Rhodnius prolixus TaxID=13249 RepID=T1HBD7_RHOPR